MPMTHKLHRPGLVIHVVFVIPEMMQQMTHLWCDNNSDFLRIDNVPSSQTNPSLDFSSRWNAARATEMSISPYEVQKSSNKPHICIQTRCI